MNRCSSVVLLIMIIMVEKLFGIKGWKHLFILAIISCCLFL
ncbi:MAG: hypothetical protein ACKPKO_27895 [Candidatus Fonsibacter sp.]